MVRAADVRSALDMGKAELQCLIPVALELGRFDESCHRVMTAARSKVLADTQITAAGCPYGSYRLQNLGVSLPKAEHDSRLYRYLRGRLMGTLQQLQRTLIISGCA